MKRRDYILYLTFALLAACSPHAHSDDHDSSDKHEHSADGHASVDRHESDEHEHSADEIIIPADKAKAAGIVVETANPGDFSSVLKTGGKILAASGDESVVAATVAGVVSLNRQFTDGTPVAKGSPLFTISTANLEEGDISTRASIAFNTAKAEYERAEKLVADKIITEKEYLAAKAEYDRARLAYEAVGKKSSRGITVSASKGGYVKECNVKDGDFVEVGRPLMTITQNRNLHLMAEVAERDYAVLGNVVSARFKPSYSDKIYDLSELGGHLVSYGRGAATSSPFIPVTFEFTNTSGVVPGAYAEVFLVTGKRENVLSLPLSALVEEQGIFSVYVKEGEDHYHKHEVSLGDSDGRRVEIKKGIEPGDNVVTEGAIRIKLASASSAIPAHNHNH